MNCKKEFNKLKTIYIPISYHTLFGRLPSWRKKNYLLYYRIKKTYDIKNYAEVLSISLKKNIGRAMSFILYDNTSISCSVLGWGTNFKSEDSRDLIETGIAAAQRHTRDNIYSPKYQEIYNENISYLRKLINWCELKNIDVVLFTTPAFETYRTNLNPNQLNVMIQSSNKIASEYENCRYINMLNDSTFIESDFFDADHLSEIGAKKLSTRLSTLK